MYTLAILGGGMQGCALFVNLPEHVRQRTVVIDPESSPLRQFERQCRAVGVPYLRSPGSHSLHADFTHLLRYAARAGYDKNVHFVDRYLNPSLEVFMAHSRGLLQERAFEKHHLRVRAVRLRFETAREWSKRGAWNIVCRTHGSDNEKTREISARYVILATGQQPTVPPQFFPALQPADHVLHENFVYPSAGSVCIIGGGMSGTQFAVTLAQRNGGGVSLTSTSASTVTNFDSNPCFIGPKCLPVFLSEPSHKKRAALLKAHRYPGTINPRVSRDYERERERGNIFKIDARVEQIEKSDRAYRVRFSNGDERDFVSVVCATGLSRPAGNPADAENSNTLSGDLINAYNLPHVGGVPVVDETLEWHNKLYVCGPLAELEIGPAAKNIIGAHLTYRRLCHVWEEWK